MTNLDAAPSETLLAADPCHDVTVIEPREVPLGGIRAMTVRRTLPARGRPFIGPWCFADHYGPDNVADTGGMDVAPHPHIGLSTVSWLFRGEIEHRDSLGTRALVLPGEINLMTAGHGISHSEVSTKQTSILHGVQLWVALPPELRGMEARFDHFAPEAATDSGVTWRVFLGSIGGQTSPIVQSSPMVGAEIDMVTGSRAHVPLDPAFEHGVLVDTGPVLIDGHPAPARHLVALPRGRTRVTLATGDHGPGRVLLIGGTPIQSDLVMWWNFVGGSHEEIVQARADWMAGIDRAPFDDADSAKNRPGAAVDDGRFGVVRGYDGSPLPAPRLPGGRLKPRRADDSR